jgi:preprotein translocase subunit SecG
MPRRPVRDEGIRRVETALNLVMIIVSIVLMLVILLKTKGSSFSGAFGGDTGSIYRTRRGVEKTLFRFTIGVAIVFVLLAVASTVRG